MSRPIRSALLAALAALLLSVPAMGIAAPKTGVVRSVSLLSSGWVPLDGELSAGVRLTVDGESPPVTVRLRLEDRSGVVRWDESSRRSGLGPVTTQLSFATTVPRLGLEAGVYTLRAEVTAGGLTVAERARQVIVADPDVRAVPVAVLVRVLGTPASMSDADGASIARTRADAGDVARLATVKPGLRLTAAVPPYLLSDWLSASIVTGDEALEATAADAARDTLEALRGAMAAGVPLVRSMYGEPDLALLADDAVAVRDQLDAGDAMFAAAFGKAQEASGFAVLSDLLPADAASVIARTGVRWAIVDTACVDPAGSARPRPVPYRVTVGRRGVAASEITVLALDRPSSALLADPASADRLAARLYERTDTQRDPEPVLLEIAVGPGGVTAADVDRAATAIARLPWVRLIDAPTAAASTTTRRATLRERPSGAVTAPAGYRAALDRARRRVRAFAAAAGHNDPRVRSAKETMLRAESRVWAGADGSWGAPQDGLDLAAAAETAAWSVMSRVTLDAVDVTLPGSEGDVPVSVINGSDRTLTVSLSASSPTMRVERDPVTVRLRPGENIVTVPVALGTSADGRLRLSLRSGGLELSRAVVRVRASYLDRIVLLGAALVILIALLLYIRRRAFRRQPDTEAG